MARKHNQQYKNDETVKSDNPPYIVTSRHDFVSAGPVKSTTSGFPDTYLCRGMTADLLFTRPSKMMASIYNFF
jgi:hypothetical protein